MICAVRIEVLLGRGLDGAADDADRAAAAVLVESLYQQERDRLTKQVEDELGPLALALYVPGSTSPGQTRLDALLAGSCVHQSLLRGRDSADLEVQARSRRIWDRFYAPVELAPTEHATLRLVLPPSDLIVAGELFTGSVVDDRLRDGDASSRRAVGDGLLVEAADQTVQVGRDGLFVLRAPERAGTYLVEVRHREKSSPLPIDGQFTVAAPGAADEAPLEAPPAAPRVLLPDQPLVVRGRQLGGGSGLATRAFVGPWEVSVLAKTPTGAIFDVERVPAGPHPLTLFEGGELIAAAAIDRVTLSASSDRASLDRGESAAFEVSVAGVPVAPPATSAAPAGAAASSAVAFLDYVNNTPEVGQFHGRPDRFSVPIAGNELVASPAPVRVWDQRVLIDRVEGLLRGPGPRAPGATGAAPSADGAGDPAQPGAANARAAASGAFDHVQHYRAARVGDFHVRVTVRLPDESMGSAAMIVPPPPGARSDQSGGGGQQASVPIAAAAARLLTGVDDRGAFVDVDGQRFYFSIGYTPIVPSDPPPVETGRLFESACSGSCQCQIQSWDHAAEVGERLKAMDRSNPAWRGLAATARGCACAEARSRCYSLLSFECKARCKRFFESSLTERVSGFAVGAEVGECRDAGACEE